MKKSLSLIIILIICSVFVQADYYFQTGNDLLKKLKLKDEVTQDELVAYGVGSGYISAIWDFGYMVSIVDSIEIEVWDTSRNVTIVQLIDVVVKYLEDNPKYRDLPASSSVYAAFHEAFPKKEDNEK